jgi:hypothetical protein
LSLGRSALERMATAPFIQPSPRGFLVPGRIGVNCQPKSRYRCHSFMAATTAGVFFSKDYMVLIGVNA